MEIRGRVVIGGRVHDPISRDPMGRVRAYRASKAISLSFSVIRNHFADFHSVKGSVKNGEVLSSAMIPRPSFCQRENACASIALNGNDASMRLERSSQAIVVRWARRRGLFIACYPNGAGGKTIMPGVVAGMPDLFVFDPPPIEPLRPGTVVEMKRLKGGRLSAEQVETLDRLAALGWFTIVAKGEIEAINGLEELGY